VTAAVGHAQDRLVGARALVTGVGQESITFGGEGLLQGPVAGLDSLRIRSVVQRTIPIALSVPVGDRWALDLTAFHAHGAVTVAPGPRGNTATRTLVLAGPSDVRLRATGRIAGDALLVTAGVNVPSGRESLAGDAIGALRTLAAPALALGAPPVGSGLGATLGLLATRRIGDWRWVGGASWEYRGTVQPIAQLGAAATATTPIRYDAGAVLRLSAATEGFIGQHRLVITTATELYGTDRLTGTVTGTGRPTATTIRLGPAVSADAQLQLAVPGAREVALWSAARWRAPFARDGVRVTGSDGTYLDGGLRTVLPLRHALDLVTALDGRWHSGLAIDAGLPAARALVGSATLGLAWRRGRFSLQPWARLQTGSVGARDDARPGARSSLLGRSLGLALVTRF
jgi:hypothetical protein